MKKAILIFLIILSGLITACGIQESSDSSDKLCEPFRVFFSDSIIDENDIYKKVQNVDQTSGDITVLQCIGNSKTVYIAIEIDNYEQRELNYNLNIIKDSEPIVFSQSIANKINGHPGQFVLLFDVITSQPRNLPEITLDGNITLEFSEKMEDHSADEPLYSFSWEYLPKDIPVKMSAEESELWISSVEMRAVINNNDITLENEAPDIKIYDKNGDVLSLNYDLLCNSNAPVYITMTFKSLFDQEQIGKIDIEGLVFE